MKKIISLILVLILVVGCIPLGSMAESGETTAGESTGPGSDTGGAGTESGANTGDSGAGTDTGDTNTGDTGSGGDLGTDTGDTGTGDTAPAPTDWDATHFRVSEDGATVLGFTEAGLQMLSKKRGNLVFPENLDATIIGVSAFQENTGIISVTMNRKITTIGDRAFYGDSNLTILTMGDVLSSIGDSAFEDCSINHAITIPHQMRFLGHRAFKSNAIVKVTLGAYTELTIGRFVFESNRIEDVDMHALDNVKGYMFDNSSTALHSGLLSTGIFKDNQIQRVEFPATLWAIGERAFDSNHLIELELPANIKNVYYWGFSNNSQLSKVVIRREGIQLDRGCFMNCGIRELSLPESINQWGGFSFQNNDIQDRVFTLPNMNYVGYESLRGNKNIETIVVNNVLVQFDAARGDGHGNVVYYGALGRIPNLKNIRFQGLIQDKTFHSYFCAGGSLKSIEIPHYINRIGRGAFVENRGWYEGTDLVALYRKDFASDEYVLDNNVTDSAENGYIVNPVLLEFRFVDDSGNAIGSAPKAAVTIKRKKGGTPLSDQTVVVTGVDIQNFKLGDEISFGIPAVSDYTFKEAAGSSTLANAGEGDALRYSVTLNPDQVTDVSYGDGYEVGYKKFVVTLKYQSAAAPQGTNASEEETTEATTLLTEATTPKTEVTSPTTEATASAPDTTVSAENTTAAQATSPQEEATTAASITTDSIAQVTSAAVITTTPPVTTIARRDFDFVDISELIPLGVTTLTEEDTPLGINTAPLDLELLLSSEDIPLAGIIVDSPTYLAANELPYTGFTPNEIFIGLGMIVAALGIAIKKKGA